MNTEATTNLIVKVILFIGGAIPKYILLGLLNLVSGNLIFLLYTFINPQTFGFMADESPYGWEELAGGVVFSLIAVAIQIPLAGWWEYRSENIKDSFGYKVIAWFSLFTALIYSLLLFGYFLPSYPGFYSG